MTPLRMLKRDHGHLTSNAKDSNPDPLANRAEKPGSHQTSNPMLSFII